MTIDEEATHATTTVKGSRVMTYHAGNDNYMKYYIIFLFEMLLDLN